MLGFFPTIGFAQSPEAQAFFEKHLLIDGTCFPHNRPGSALQRYFRDGNGKFDMAEYRAQTGVDFAVWDIRHHAEMMKMIRGVELGHFINVRILRTFADMEATFRAKQQGWLFYTQHPWTLNGTIEPISSWHRDGLRMLQITYGSTLPVPSGDELGTGSSNEDSEAGGLTKLGQEVVAECNRLGIIVDVSHCSRQTTLDVAAASKTPITVTHAGCEAITSTKRNKSDDEIRAIARTGGVFGITPVKFMLNDAPSGASLDDFIRHLEHVIRIAGIDHVGIGSDIPRNGVPEDELPAYTCPELNSEKRWFHLYDALKAKGYTEDQMTKIFGLNFLRVFRTVLKP
jgi:membrane dipeptidase